MDPGPPGGTPGGRAGEGRPLVAGGTKAKAGDAIAGMGRTGAVRDMLHFEIRRNGKPVDPLLFLPKQ